MGNGQLTEVRVINNEHEPVPVKLHGGGLAASVTASRQQWEYSLAPLHLNLDPSSPMYRTEWQKAMNNLGRDGWEVVTVHQNEYLLKRPK
jgi:hypothetical protein